MSNTIALTPAHRSIARTMVRAIEQVRTSNPSANQFVFDYPALLSDLSLSQRQAAQGFPPKQVRLAAIVVRKQLMGRAIKATSVKIEKRSGKMSVVVKL